MGFKFGNAASGGAKGALAGSTFGPWGAAIGGALGGITGGFSKDIDKKVTGNSQSGVTNNAINIASLAGGGIGLAKNGGSGILGMFGKGNSGAAPTLGTSNVAAGANNISSYFNPAAGAPLQGFGQTGAVNTGGGGILNKFGGLLKKNPLATAGLATAGAGLLAGRSPDVPQLPQSAQDYAAQVRGGGSPLNKLATGKLTEGLNQPFQQVSADEEAAATRQLELDQTRELDQVRDLYRNIRPGSDPSTDSSFQRDLGQVNDRYAQLKADTVSQLHRQVYNDYQGQQLQRILGAGQLDQGSQQALQQVAQWDIDQIATQFGIDYQDAQQLKLFLMNEGQAIFNSQLPNQNPFAQFFQQNGAA